MLRTRGVFLKMRSIPFVESDSNSYPIPVKDFFQKIDAEAIIELGGSRRPFPAATPPALQLSRRRPGGIPERLIGRSLLTGTCEPPSERYDPRRRHGARGHEFAGTGSRAPRRWPDRPGIRAPRGPRSRRHPTDGCGPRGSSSHGRSRRRGGRSAPGQPDPPDRTRARPSRTNRGPTSRPGYPVPWP